MFPKIKTLKNYLSTSDAVIASRSRRPIASLEIGQKLSTATKAARFILSQISREIMLLLIKKIYFLCHVFSVTSLTSIYFSIILSSLTMSTF